MNNVKRILSFLMAITMIFSLVPTAAFASTSFGLEADTGSYSEKTPEPSSDTELGKKATISVNVNDITDMDYDSYDSDLVSDTVAIDGTEDPLQFVNGEQVWDYSTARSNALSGTRPTAPSEGYYFAGWFSGLTVDEDGMITVDKAGRYILSDAGTLDDTSFAGVECRPKYDEAPESGTYNALWIHDNNTNDTIIMMLEVYESTFTYRKAIIANSTNAAAYHNDVFRAAWAGAEGNGRVKMVKDMTVAYLEKLTSDGFGASISFALKLDMNGCTLTGVTPVDNFYSSMGRSILTLTYGTNGNSLESSYGQGCFEQTHFKMIATPVVKLQANNETIIRDIDIISHNTEYAYSQGLLVDLSEVDLIENVKIDVSATGSTPANIKALVVKGSAARATQINSMNNCTVKSGGYLISAENASAALDIITNCTMTSSATGDFAPIDNDGMITFGKGNTITSTSSGLFNGTGELAFTEDGTYQCAEGGNVLGADVKVIQTPEAGTFAVNDNGKLVFVPGFSLKFYSHDGSALLYSDTYRSGEVPVDHEVTYDTVGITAYKHLGWSTTMGGTELTDPTKLTADTKLYAVRKEETLPAVVSVSIDGGEEVKYASWELAMNSIDSAEAIVVKLLADTEGSAAFNTALYKITLDLNGCTLTYTGSSQALYTYTGHDERENAFVLTSSAEGKGTLILAEGAKGVVYSKTTDESFLAVPVTISNVRIEAPYLAANTAYDADGAVITIVNQFASNIETLTMTDVEIVADNCPAVEFSIANTNAGCRINADFTDVQLSGNPVAVATKGNGDVGTTHVNLTVDANSSFKGAEGTYPIQESNGNVGLTPNYPTGYEMTKGTDGWYKLEKHLYVGGTNVSGTAPEIDISDNANSVEIKNADMLGELDSLTLTSNDDVVLKFLADALDSIGSLAAGNATISIESAVADTENHEVVRYDLKVTNSDGEEVKFNGEVEVSIPFSLDANTDSSKYRVFYVDDNGRRQDMRAIISGDAANGYLAKFTTNHFSYYSVAELVDIYSAELETNTDSAAKNDTVIVKVNVGSDKEKFFNSAKIVITYDKDKLEYVENSGACNGKALDGSALTAADVKAEFFVDETNGTVTILDYGEAMATGSGIYSLSFKALDGGYTDVAMTAAAFSTDEQAEANDLSPVSTISTKTIAVNHSVTLNNEATGTVAPNGTYKVQIPNYNTTYYTYTVTAKVNGSGVDYTIGADGTIAVNNVTDDLVVTYSSAGNPFNITWVDEGSGVDSESATGTYGMPVTFTVAADKDSGIQTGHKYTVKVTLTDGGAELDKEYITIEENADKTKTYTIAAAGITGDITITVIKTTVDITQVTFEINGDDVVAKDAAGNEIETGVVAIGDKITLELTPEAGFTYKVTIGEDATVILNNTITTYELTVGNKAVVINVSKVVSATANVVEYLTLDGKTMWLITIGKGEDERGRVYTYNNELMYWSSEYDAYATLVVGEEQGSVDTSAVKFHLRALDATKNEKLIKIDYSTMDINGSGTKDINDAQLVWNMYTCKYKDFDTVSIEKFLRADVNGSYGVDMSDAAAIVNALVDAG